MTKHETKIATVENLFTAICFGAGALLVVLALHTLSTVKTVNAVSLSRPGPVSSLVSFGGGTSSAGTYFGALSEVTSSPGKAN